MRNSNLPSLVRRNTSLQVMRFKLFSVNASCARALSIHSMSIAHFESSIPAHIRSIFKRVDAFLLRRVQRFFAELVGHKSSIDRLRALECVARHLPKIWHSKKNCLQMKRNARNTPCWLIWVATILDASVNLVQFMSIGVWKSNAFRT